MKALFNDSQLNSSFQCLLVCALWSSGEEYDDCSVSDFSNEAREELLKDWISFVSNNEYLIQSFIEQEQTDLGQVAHVYWLASNGHGCGFFDYNGEAAFKLNALFDDFRSYGFDLYISDSNQVELM